MKLIYQGFGVVALLSTAVVLTAQESTAFLKTNQPDAGVFVDGNMGPEGSPHRPSARPAGQLSR